MNINSWHQIAGKNSAVFEVIDPQGERVNNEIEKGNYLRITIPVVPGSPAGEGSDWVRIEKIEEQNKEQYQCVAISVRPSPAPINNEREVAHFFSPDATSTFSVERHNRLVVASVNGRNEVPNTKTNSLWAAIRNFFIAIGAMLGLNKPQWKGLVKGLIKKRL